MEIAALLTGRGNSTFKNKNYRKINGLPVMSYPGRAAKKSSYINSFWVSSDSDKILAIGKKEGFIGIKRPDELAAHDSRHVDAINHALEVMKSQNVAPDILVVIMANSVTIKTEWIDSCIKKLLEDRFATACVPVYKELDHHPYRAKFISADGYLESFFDFSQKEISSNRQDLEPSYFLCHNFWVINLNTAQESKAAQPWSFMGSKVLSIEVKDSFDIHDLSDLKRSKEWLRKNGI